MQPVGRAGAGSLSAWNMRRCQHFDLLVLVNANWAAGENDCTDRESCMAQGFVISHIESRSAQQAQSCSLTVQLLLASNILRRKHRRCADQMCSACLHASAVAALTSPSCCECNAACCSQKSGFRPTRCAPACAADAGGCYGAVGCCRWSLLAVTPADADLTVSDVQMHIMTLLLERHSSDG